MASQPRRILVAMDARPESLLALECAAALASRLDAEIAGLFIEDEALLRLCGLPVFEVTLGGGLARHPEMATLAREMRARAGAARRALERAAAPHRLSWTFRVTRGRLDEEVLAAEPGAHIVAPSRAVRRGAARRAPVIAAVATDDGDEQALVLAAHLARAGRAPLLVLAPDSTLADPDRLRARIETAIGTDLPVQIAGYSGGEETGLETCIEPLALEVLVLGAPAAFTPERLGRLAAAAGCDLVVLSTRAETSSTPGATAVPSPTGGRNES